MVLPASKMGRTLTRRHSALISLTHHDCARRRGRRPCSSRRGRFAVRRAEHADVATAARRSAAARGTRRFFGLGAHGQIRTTALDRSRTCPAAGRGAAAECSLGRAGARPSSGRRGPGRSAGATKPTRPLAGARRRHAERRLRYVSRRDKPDKSGTKSLASVDVSCQIPRPFGAVAQLGERMTGSHEVRGSIPLGSTRIFGIVAIRWPTLWPT